MAQKIDRAVSELIKGPVMEKGYELADVEFRKEPDGMYLRIYIYSRQGIGIDDCVAVHRIIEPLIDDNIDIQGSYTLEVSSPGYDRKFKNEEDFKRYMGETVEVRLYKSNEKGKIFSGILSGYGEGNIEIVVDDETLRFLEKDVASVKRKFVD
ncbi:MAG TPA: ribosome maturation factor RimP [Clostridia bacterium]|nr:ribosome maturation factor RimP [Clostridia bacterium]HPQ46439.1 ribosome maturation factor RimP [Clostridia bacterium]HRX42343.1 ribosome maturation factor RimP [Clostridia bacterium]